MIFQTDQKLTFWLIFQVTKLENHLVKPFTNADVSNNVSLYKRKHVDAWSNSCPYCYLKV